MDGTLVYGGDDDPRRTKCVGGEGEPSWGGDGNVSHISWQGAQEPTYDDKR